MIGLDGYELTLADAMINMGQLPSLARIREKSAQILIRSWLGKRDGACVGAREFRPIAKRCGTLVISFFR